MNARLAPPAAHRVPPELATWVRRAARCGYVAKGAVYLLLGTLAGYAALVPGAAPADTGGAMVRLRHLFGGPVLLVPLAVGLAAYAVWRVTQALFDPECHGECGWRQRWGPRLAFLCSGIFYAVLACDAAAHVVLSGSGEHGREQAHWTAWALHLPLGRWLVAGIGVGIVVFGTVELWRAIRVRMADRLGGGHYHVALLALGSAGIVARALVFGLAGALLIRAAWTATPHRTEGLAAALRTLRQQPYGPWLLGAAALGLVAFGLFQFALARYRYIETS